MTDEERKRPADTRHKLSPEDRSKFESDLLLFGRAYTKMLADGTVQYVPRDQWQEIEVQDDER